MISEYGLHTVCQEAKCPNINNCFNAGNATFLILGDSCTRNCSFCAVKELEKSKNGLFDPDEPYKISELVSKLNLKYVVITSVTRDDLEDGGADAFAETILLLRKLNKNIKIEALIPDFNGKISSIETVVFVSPDVIGHNIETVKRFYKDIRPMANYERSLGVLKSIKEISPKILTKSSIMLGFGEQQEEVIAAMKDLRQSNCDILTLGQYLAPSEEHFSVKEFIPLEQFKIYEKIGYDLGFGAVLSGPLVRSSYLAETAYTEVAQCMI